MKSIKILIFLICIAYSQEPKLVMDINAYVTSDFFLFNDALYFAAYEPETGEELYKYQNNQIQLFDIEQEPYEGEPELFTKSGKYMFFKAKDMKHGYELWKTDGTPENTTLVKDIYSGTGTSTIFEMIDFSGILYFDAKDSINGKRLWKSDGTKEGTVPFNSVATDFRGSPTKRIIEYKNNLIFTGIDSISGKELWISNGTEQGTFILKDIYPGKTSSSPDWFTEFKGYIYFSAFDESNSRSLWRTDGTKDGTKKIKTFVPDNWIEISKFVVTDNYLFFVMFDNGVEFGDELWKTDGTEKGTSIVKDIREGPTGSMGFHYLIGLNDIILFWADDGQGYGLELWRSDGTEEGTYMLRDINEGEWSSYPYSYTVNKNNAYFVAQNKLWVSNGTSEGTYIYDESLPGYGTLIIYNGQLLFTTGGEAGSEIWSIELITSINENEESLYTYNLSQNYPNPFNPYTTIEFKLNKIQYVRLDVFNILGEKIITLVDEQKNAGEHIIQFDASNLSSGIYIYKLSTNDFSKQKKMLLIK